jgi:hypothetical protein
MDDTTIAQAIHVIAVILWIGGVGFVTTVMLPAMRHMKGPVERLAFFDDIERRFAWQAQMRPSGGAIPGVPPRRSQNRRQDPAVCVETEGMDRESCRHNGSRRDHHWSG